MKLKHEYKNFLKIIRISFNLIKVERIIKNCLSVKINEQPGRDKLGIDNSISFVTTRAAGD